MIPQASNIGDNLIKIRWLYLFLFSFNGNTLPSNDNLYGVTSGFVFSTDQSATRLLNL